MPRFAYKATGGGGGGVIDAPDRAVALRELLRRGETPSAIEELGMSGAAGAISNGAVLNGRAASSSGFGADDVGDAAKSAMSSLGGRVMSLSELANFMRELSTALRAGLPLVQAIRTIAKTGRSVKQKAMMATLIEQVEHGKPLSDAFAAQGPPFNELTINLARAGEASGKLGEVLGYCATLLDKDVKLRASLKSALTYPAMIGLLVVAAVIVVTTFIVPRILKDVAAQATKLPWPTRVLQDFAYFFGHYWWLVLGLGLAAILAWNVFYKSPKGRLWFDENILKVPIVGKLMRDVAVARFTRTLSTLTSSGIPVVTALRVTKGTLGNVAMENVIDAVIDQVSAGRTIAQPMEESGYFPPMLVQIVNMGERSGRLEELLTQAADAFEERTQQSVKTFTDILPPILVLILALVVGFVVLAILMALLSVQDAVMKG